MTTTSFAFTYQAIDEMDALMRKRRWSTLCLVASLLSTSRALACFDPGAMRQLLFRTFNEGMTVAPNVAEVRISRILSQFYAEAQVVKAIKGFEGVREVLIYGGGGSCHAGVSNKDVGKTFFIGGRIQHRAAGLPLFQGNWAGHDLPPPEVPFLPPPPE